MMESITKREAEIQQAKEDLKYLEKYSAMPFDGWLYGESMESKKHALSSFKSALERFEAVAETDLTSEEKKIIGIEPSVNISMDLLSRFDAKLAFVKSLWRL